MGKLCSRKCVADSQKGKPAPCSFSGRNHKSDSIAKMSLVQKEIGKTEKKKETARKNGLANKGKKRTEEFRQKRSELYKELGYGYWLPIKSGAEHWNWKGGITPLKTLLRKSYKYRKWRKEILDRDGHVCQICGASGKCMEVDHFPVRFAELVLKHRYDDLWKINNGRTLCKECHKIVTFNI